MNKYIVADLERETFDLFAAHSRGEAITEYLRDVARREELEVHELSPHRLLIAEEHEFFKVFERARYEVLPPPPPPEPRIVVSFLKEEKW